MHYLSGLGKLALAGFLCAACNTPPSNGASPTAVARPATGATVYAEHCAICHGDTGKGDGPEAKRFTAAPRDFIKGEYRFRSTGSGKLPTDDDLRRSVVAGLGGTGMVPQNHLNDTEVEAVIDFIKSMNPGFADEPRAKIVKLPKAPEVVDLSRGREVYGEAGCDGCHGDTGRGDGRSAADLSIAPTNLARHPLKGGSTAADILRSVVTGLNGTPMPSYHLLFDDDDMWHLAHYVESLGSEQGMTDQERIGWEVEKRTP